MLYWFGLVSFTLFGLLFGSFGNVLVWRVPRGESIVSPGSHCPGCGSLVRWYDNVPVVSWLLLRGKCRDCGTPIAVRYVILEVSSGLLFAIAVVKFGVSAQAIAAAAMFWLLLVLSAIDLDHMRLPNPIVGALAVIGLVGVVTSQLSSVTVAPILAAPDSGPFSSPLAWALLGVAVGAGMPALIALAYRALRGKRGLGMGDVKLLGALGFFLGPYVALTLFLGSLIGAVAGVLAARRGSLGTTKIPFGPALAAGAVLTALVGPELVRWYLRVAGLL